MDAYTGEFNFNVTVEKEILTDTDYLKNLQDLYELLIGKIDEVSNRLNIDFYASLYLDNEMKLISEELEVNVKRLDLIKVCLLNTQKLTSDAPNMDTLFLRVQDNNSLFHYINSKAKEAKNKFQKLKTLWLERVENEELINIVIRNYEFIRKIELQCEFLSDKIDKVNMFFNERSTEFLLSTMKQVEGELRVINESIKIANSRLNSTRNEILKLERNKKK